MKQSEISRSAWALFENVKDAATTSLTNAVASGRLRIDRAALPLLLMIVKDAVDQSFDSGYRSFEKTLQKAMTALTVPQTTDTGNPIRKQTKKN